jgi:hypothetical protein
MRHSINPVSTILRNLSSTFISPLNPPRGTFIFVKKSNKIRLKQSAFVGSLRQLAEVRGVKQRLIIFAA